MAEAMHRQIRYLIMQYFRDNGLIDSVHTLERESGLHFDVNHLQEMVVSGYFDEAEDYLNGFINAEGGHAFSLEISITDIKRLKFFEALNNGAHNFARDIVNGELAEMAQYSQYNQGVYELARGLVEMDNFRSHPLMNNYNTEQERQNLMQQIQTRIQENPDFMEKLQMPPLPTNLEQLYMNGAALLTNGPVRRNNNNNNG